jgi:hypothetical protein
MNKKYTLLSISILALLASFLACNAPVTTVTPVPDVGGGGPGSGIITETPELPPPAIAVLRVAYIKGDNVWLWTEGSGISQLTAAGGAMAPVLSGDGQKVAFLRSGELWAVNADGSNERQLVSAAFLSTLATPGDTAEVKDHVWIPGSQTIYFNTLVVAGEAGYRIPQVDLYSVNADAGADEVTTQESPGSGGVPNFSPDGTLVALAQPDKIIFKDVAGTFRSIALTFPNILTYSEWSYVPEVVWLSDSSGVRVVIPASDPLADPTQPSTFWNVPVSGSSSVLTTFVAAPAFASFPYISPDGELVLYMAEIPDGLDLHTIRSDGTDTFYSSFAIGGVELVGWTPDSVHFMFWRVPTQVSIMAVGEDLALGDTPVVTDVKWIGSARYLFLNTNELRIGILGEASSMIDAGVTDYNLGFWIH